MKAGLVLLVGRHVLATGFEMFNGGSTPIVRPFASAENAETCQLKRITQMKVIDVSQIQITNERQHCLLLSSKYYHGAKVVKCYYSITKVFLFRYH